MHKWFIAISLLLTLLQSASAEEPKYYLSVKYGAAKSNMNFYDDAYFKNDDGSTREIEFFWGNFTAAKFVGGVRVTPKNKVNGYSANLILKNKSIISIRSYMTDDEFVQAPNDWGYGRTMASKFGKLKAVSTEYSYISSMQGSTFLSWTYGTSNYPAYVKVSPTPSQSDEKNFVDPRPKFQYFYFTLDSDPIRSALLNGEEVSSQAYAGDLFYFQSKIGFGFYRYTLSDAQYSTTYDNENNKYGLSNESGTEIYMALNLEPGIHKTIHLFGGKGIGSIGYYYSAPPSAIFSALYKFNKTSKGYYFNADGSAHYGLIARFALAF